MPLMSNFKVSFCDVNWFLRVICCCCITTWGFPLFHTSIIVLIADLQATTLALDFRVTALEENGNQTLTELELRVETLEGTVAHHETRISAAEVDIDGNRIP